LYVVRNDFGTMTALQNGDGCGADRECRNIKEVLTATGRYVGFATMQGGLFRFTDLWLGAGELKPTPFKSK
jgi:hypothetical protein